MPVHNAEGVGILRHKLETKRCNSKKTSVRIVADLSVADHSILGQLPSITLFVAIARSVFEDIEGNVVQLPGERR